MSAVMSYVHGTCNSNDDSSTTTSAEHNSVSSHGWHVGVPSTANPVDWKPSRHEQLAGSHDPGKDTTPADGPHVYTATPMQNDSGGHSTHAPSKG
eukprot:1613972-Rhodomonas_salina.1